MRRLAARRPTGPANCRCLCRASYQTGDGKPLDRSARATMETALGEDLSDVRLHTDQRSASAARRLDAVAFTSGQDVFFGAGRPGLKTPSGRRLLAHELTHTIQGPRRR